MLKNLTATTIIATIVFAGSVRSASGHSMNCQSMSGCSMNSASAQTGKKFGQEPDSLALKVEIQDLLKNPDRYLEKPVIIQGRVREECPGGHWLVIENPKDTSSTIHVDFTKAGFVVPQMIGVAAAVYGRFIVQDKNPDIQGRGVTFGDHAPVLPSQSKQESSPSPNCCH